MIFRVRDLVNIYRQIAANCEMDERDVPYFHALLTALLNTGETIDVETVEKFMPYLDDNYPQMAYVTKEIMKTCAQQDYIVMSEQEIKLYANLAICHAKNEKKFC